MKEPANANSSTITALRRENILEHIRKHSKGDVNEFAEKYGVSTVTIRSDLNYLEKKGCITRCYGGALLNKQFSFDQSLNDKSQINSDIKEKLGAYAASLIKDGDTIILDSGSTTERIARHLNDSLNLTVMTNAINVAYHLANRENIELMVTGGVMRPNSFSLVGIAGENMLEGYHFDKLFLGADGFDKCTGVTTPHRGEASINRKMLEAAQQIIVVTDSSKFNRQSFCRIANPQQIDVLITDSGIPDDYREALVSMGIDVRVVH